MFDPVMAGQRHGGKNRTFSNFKADIGKIMKNSNMGLLRACFLNNSTIFYKMTSILKNLLRYCRCILPKKPKGHNGRPAAAASGRPLWARGVYCCLYYCENDAQEIDYFLSYDQRHFILSSK